jgi:hypothetical protein
MVAARRDAWPERSVGADRSGVISQIGVTLTDLTHSFPDDLDLRLTSPTGRTVVLMSDVGGSVPATNVTLMLRDDATEDLPYGDGATCLSSGSLRPRRRRTWCSTWAGCRCRVPRSRTAGR